MRYRTEGDSRSVQTKTVDSHSPSGIIGLILLELLILFVKGKI